MCKCKKLKCFLKFRGKGEMKPFEAHWQQNVGISVTCNFTTLFAVLNVSKASI